MKKIFLALFLLALAGSALAEEKSTVTVDVKPPEGKEATIKDVLEYFADEPTIQDVQAAAIEYAEVHPDKILKWRRKAKYKALVPTVGFDYGENRDVSPVRYGVLSTTTNIPTDQYELPPHDYDRN